MAIYGNQELFSEGVSNVTGTPSVELGTRRVYGGREYVYVYNASTATASVNHGVVWASNGYSATISSLGGDGLAGVVYNTEIPPSSYGWVVSRGFVSLTVAENGPGVAALNDTVVLSTGGCVVGRSANSMISGVNVASPVSLTASGGVFNAYINC